MGKTVKIGPILKYYWPKQTHFGAMFVHRIFLTHNDLTYQFQILRNRITSATTCNSRIAKSFPDLVGISIGKWPSVMEKHSRSLCSRGYISQTQTRFLTRFMTLRRRHRKLSRDTKIIKNQHWEIHQLYARKSMKVRKLYWKSDTFFPPRGSPSRVESSQFATNWSASLEL